MKSRFCQRKEEVWNEIARRRENERRVGRKSTHYQEHRIQVIPGNDEASKTPIRNRRAYIPLTLGMTAMRPETGRRMGKGQLTLKSHSKGIDSPVQIPQAHCDESRYYVSFLSAYRIGPIRRENDGTEIKTNLERRKPNRRANLEEDDLRRDDEQSISYSEQSVEVVKFVALEVELGEWKKSE